MVLEIFESPKTLVDSHVRVQASKAESPTTFLWWTGLGIIASACGRAVCTRILGPHGPPLHPNLFIALIGPPNSGKTVAVRGVMELLDALRIRRVPDSTPPERLLTWASKATQACLEENRDTGIVVACENMDSLFDRAMPRSLKAFLCSAYDCSNSYIRETQKRGREPIQKLCLNMALAGTPAHLATAFQATDWQDGIASRFLFPASQDVRVGGILPWPGPELGEALLSDLQAIRGRMDPASPLEIPWTPEAWRAREAWRLDSRSKPASHPHAGGYWDRRDTNAAKIALVLAISTARGLDCQIDTGAWDGALLALDDLEGGLDYALSLTGANPYAAVQSRLCHWLGSIGTRPVGEWEVRRWLAPFVQPRDVQVVIDTLVFADQMKVLDGESPRRTFQHPRHYRERKPEGVLPWKRGNSG